MGTRALTAVYIDGTHKVAQFGRWDGYYEGQGTTCVNFIKKIIADGRLEEFKDKVRQCTWISQEDYDAHMSQAVTHGFYDSGILAQLEKEHPLLSWNCGSEALITIIESDTPSVLLDSLWHAADSLLCEYAYVIDLDTEMFEIYRPAFEPHTGGRFSEMTPPSNAKPLFDEQWEICPVKMVKSYKLTEIPDNWIPTRQEEI